MKIKKLLIGIISALTLSAAVPVFAAETAPVEAEPIVQDIPVFAQSGSNGGALLPLNLPAGAYKAHLIHDGSSNFMVRCYIGKYYDTLVDTVGSYDGYAAVFGGYSGAYENAILEIQADGNWTVIIEQIVAPSTSSFFGIGDNVTGVFPGIEGDNIVTIVNTSASSNFVVKSYAFDGSSATLLADEVGDYSGLVRYKMRNTLYYIEVHSDGAWAIDFGRGEATTVVGNTTIESSESSETPAPADETVNATVPAPGNKYTLNTSTKKIHHNSCRYAKKIAPENYATTGSELNELKAHGYTTCGVCF